MSTCQVTSTGKMCVRYSWCELCQRRHVIHPCNVLLYDCLVVRFLVPVTMIICNDIMAYMFGFFFGKTPLIRLSPKKTWEGFVGGAFSTILYGIAVRLCTSIAHTPDLWKFDFYIYFLSNCLLKLWRIDTSLIGNPVLVINCASQLHWNTCNVDAQ